jgi:hypothetical protein
MQDEGKILLYFNRHSDLSPLHHQGSHRNNHPPQLQLWGGIQTEWNTVSSVDLQTSFLPTGSPSIGHHPAQHFNAYFHRSPIRVYTVTFPFHPIHSFALKVVAWGYAETLLIIFKGWRSNYSIKLHKSQIIRTGSVLSSGMQCYVVSQLTFLRNIWFLSSGSWNESNKKPMWSRYRLAWLILRPWRWRRYVNSKCWSTFNGLQVIPTQKITTAVRTSSLSKCMFYSGQLAE